MSESSEEGFSYQHRRNGSAETSGHESDAEDLKSCVNETDSGVSNAESIDSGCVPHVTRNGMALINEDITSGVDGHEAFPRDAAEAPGVTSNESGKVSLGVYARAT